MTADTEFPESGPKELDGRKEEEQSRSIPEQSSPLSSRSCRIYQVLRSKQLEARYRNGTSVGEKDCLNRVLLKSHERRTGQMAMSLCKKQAGLSAAYGQMLQRRWSELIL
jgi:hypothetical protein